MSKTGYRPDIDGLRAVSVIAVLFFHLDLGFPGGYVGVDVFFVISGFLITTLILKDIDTQTFSLTRFWERRIRRIFPALAVTVAAVLVAGYFLLIPGDLLDLAKSSVSQSLLTANFYFWRTSGYFAERAEFKPLLHTWSLAVEEQFYLGFPLLLAWTKGFSRRRLVILLGGISVVSFAASVYWSFYNPEVAFFLLPPRAWELLAGSILATLPRTFRLGTAIAEALASCGLAAILIAVFFYDGRTVFPGLAALLPVGGAACVILANRDRLTAVGRLLSTGPFVFVGLISYSLYLWHWPAIVFVRHVVVDLNWQLKACLILFSVGAATLSWKFVETPFRTTALLVTRRAVFGFAVGSIALLTSWSVVLWRSGGFPARFSRAMRVIASDVDWNGRQYATNRKAIVDRRMPVLGRSDREAPDFVLWGDSHAMALSALVESLAKEHGLKGTAILRGGSLPVPNLWRPVLDSSGRETNRFNEAALDYVLESKVKNALLIGRWSAACDGYSELELKELKDLKPVATMVADRELRALTPEESAAALSRQLTRLIAELETHGVNVWLMKQVPETGDTAVARRFLLWKRFPEFNDPPLRTKTLDDHRKRQRRAADVLDGLTSANVRLLDPTEYLFRGRRELQNYSERAIYRDDDHLTRFGAERHLRPLLEPVFRQMALERANEVTSAPH